MRSAKCLRCGLVTTTVAPSGLCATCRGVSDETHPLDSAAPTVSREPDGDSTVAPSAVAAGSVLPPGGYRYIEPVGEGGMGVVWRAERVATGQTVAIKKLQPDCFTPSGLKRFVAEARAVAVVDHPNVVRLLDFLPDPADPFLVLEYVPGQSLAAHLKEVSPLHPVRAARLLAAAARGVQAAHDAGVIHRDLKPGNLLLTPDGRVKVADFGLGKRLVEVEAAVAVGGPQPDDPQAADGLTRTGQLAGGTPGFMAPEQIDERFGPVGPAADVWGLGACLYAFVVGRPPFPGGKSNMQKVVTDPLVPPQEVNPSVPADLAAIVVKCLEKEPAKRYPSAAAVADDLDRYLTRDATVARPRSLPVRLWQRARRTPRAVVIAVGVAVLAVLLGGSLAMVPGWLKETPESIQNGYRRDLQAGKPVTLIGETGLPRHHVLRWGSATLVESWHGDGCCAFEALGPTLVELLDDPGVDGYILRADVRQLTSRQPPDDGRPPRADGNLGVYIGFARTPDGRGEGVMTMLRLTFSDHDPDFHRTKVLRDQLVRSAAAAAFTGPTRGRDSALTSHAMTYFRPAERRPGPWRTVEYVVDGAALTPRWGPGDRPVAPMAPRTLDAAEEYAVTQKRVDAEWPTAGVRVPAWNPRSPLGLYCDSAAVSVRNVVITPLTAR